MSASAILRLQKVGFTVDQVEALADFMDTQAASKADLEASEHRLDTSIMGVRSNLEASIMAVRSDLEASIMGVRSDLEASIMAVRSDLEASIMGVRSSDLEVSIMAVRSDLEGTEHRLETKLAETKGDILKSTFGNDLFGAVAINVVTVIGAMLALLKLAGH